MEGLEGCADILVVVTMGKKGATLPEGTIVPDNARVADFIPFDDILPYCSVFVSNCGYGAFQHAVSHGVPLVIGGGTEDKLEITARAERAGVAINLRIGIHSPEQILVAAEDVISNSKYKERTLALEAEMSAFEPMEVVVENIEDLNAGNIDSMVSGVKIY